jgi:hypothetical protein
MIYLQHVNIFQHGMGLKRLCVSKGLRGNLRVPAGGGLFSEPLKFCAILWLQVDCIVEGTSLCLCSV